MLNRVHKTDHRLRQIEYRERENQRRDGERYTQDGGRHQICRETYVNERWRDMINWIPYVCYVLDYEWK